MSRAQLLELGLSPGAIKHRIGSGRLHPVHRGVYAVGRPALTRQGRWQAAVLACEPARLSHTSAGALWGIASERPGTIEVSVSRERFLRRPGIIVHRRAATRGTTHLGLPVTGPADTLFDLATVLSPGALERAVNEADRLELASPERLGALAAGDDAGRPGSGALRSLLGRDTFALTDSELERRFLRLIRRAGLPAPLTRQIVNGYRVDFHWPELGLVVETDGLRYHRTAGRQGRDLERDQRHTAAGLETLRFSHAQVRHHPDHVAAVLARVIARLPA